MTYWPSLMQKKVLKQTWQGFLINLLFYYSSVNHTPRFLKYVCPFYIMPERVNKRSIFKIDRVFFKRSIV